MADLVKDSEIMQKAAYEADAIPNLASILANVSKEDEDGSEPKIGVQGSGGIVVSREKVKEVKFIYLHSDHLIITFTLIFCSIELFDSVSGGVLTERRMPNSGHQFKNLAACR